MKSKLLHRLYFILVCMATSCFYAQDDDKPETVFVTGEAKDVKKERTPLFGEAGAIKNFSFSVPFRGNDADYDVSEDRSWFTPDGINLHGGYGVHTTRTIALIANTGIDGLISKKLVVAPVYGSLLLNPKIGDETTLIVEAGIGWAFALGRGDLSGLYQKYRLGFGDGEKIGFYIEVNAYGFDLYQSTDVGTINLGICFYKFD